MEKTIFISLVLLHLNLNYCQAKRSFTINRNSSTFQIDGKPFRYISGSLHYFRIPREYWNDRLRKIRASGLNTIQIYVEWSSHEPEYGRSVHTLGHYESKKWKN